MNKVGNYKFYILLALVAIALLWLFNGGLSSKSEMDYSQFMIQMKSGNITTMKTSGNTAEITLKEEYNQKKKYTVRIPDISEFVKKYQELCDRNPEMMKALTYKDEEPSDYSFIFNIITMLLVVVAIIVFFNFMFSGHSG